MKASHTPGPWYVTVNDSTPGAERPEAIHSHSCGQIVATTWRIVVEAERQANARLIAAAPDLLRACESALFMASENDGEQNSIAGYKRALKQIQLDLSQAIAKATA